MPFELSDQTVVAANGNQSPANSASFKLIFRELLRHSSRLVPDRWNTLVFVDSYLDPGSLLKLQCSLGQLPYIFTPVVVPPDLPIDSDFRKRITLKSGTDQFESILDRLIPEQIPRVYLEGYAEMERRSLASFPRRPRRIVTANVISDEGFKFWAARNTESGASLIVAQHGGHYGSCAWSTFEEHEIRICDRYFTWGWQTEGEPKTVPMAAGKVLKKVQTLKADPKGTILWVDFSIPRYSIWLSAGPVGGQMLSYLEEQQRFARAVSPAVHDLLLLRLYVRDHGWNELTRWRQFDPTLKCYRGPKSMVQQLSESRLMIGTCNSTTILETLGADFPTLVFWNPEYWEIRPEAQPYFDELRQAGILYDTPEAAAAKVSEIYQDTEFWWRQPIIQRARERFCQRFARTDLDWLRGWKAELLREAHLAN
jgi:putative transferase (TIGR04331 family)